MVVNSLILSVRYVLVGVLVSELSCSSVSMVVLLAASGINFPQ